MTKFIKADSQNIIKHKRKEKNGYFLLIADHLQPFPNSEATTNIMINSFNIF